VKKVRNWIFIQVMYSYCSFVRSQHFCSIICQVGGAIEQNVARLFDPGLGAYLIFPITGRMNCGISLASRKIN